MDSAVTLHTPSISSTLPSSHLVGIPARQPRRTRTATAEADAAGVKQNAAKAGQLCAGAPLQAAPAPMRMNHGASRHARRCAPVAAKPKATKQQPGKVSYGADWYKQTRNAMQGGDRPRTVAEQIGTPPPNPPHRRSLATAARTRGLAPGTSSLRD